MEQLREMNLKDRAWLEINLDNLEHNINEIKKVIGRAKIMAVVKGNAYGHGLLLIAKKLNAIGIFDFAVATLSEALLLRKNKIKGNILILGYTDFSDLKLVIKYSLIQTIIDYDYFEKITKMHFLKPLKVHIKINTGMNRIGEEYQNFEKIKAMYLSKKVQVLGIYTHLANSDSLDTLAVDFTKKQIERFDLVIKKLKEARINPGATHVQASYGILNYQDLDYDYVRPGIIMYGVCQEKGLKTKVELDLKNVLTLKAKISSVREIAKGEYVGYARFFEAKEKMKVASVAIGYVDGIPRVLSGKENYVYVNGKLCPLIGKICMDQLMIDVSGVEVKTGDVVTLIGNIVPVADMAYNAGTVTIEILARLGSRLERIAVFNKE